MTSSGEGQDNPDPSGTPNDWRDLAKVGASLTAFIGAISALAVTGLLGRTERDHGDLFLAAVACVLVAAVFWVSAAIFTPGAALEKEQPRRFRRLRLTWRSLRRGLQNQKRLQFVGLLFLAAGFVCGFIAVLGTQHSPDRPTITAEVQGDKLVATVTAAGLNSNDRVIVWVDGLRIDNAPDYHVIKSQHLYFASVGADGDGNVNESVKLNVGSGRWDAVGIRAFAGDKSECQTDTSLDLVETAGPGCVIVPLLPVPRRPQLTTRWARDGDLRALTAVARATNMGGHMIALRIQGRLRRGRITLARASAEPSPAGDGTISLHVDIPKSVHSVCVEGRLTFKPLPRKLLACSISQGAVAVQVLRVPDG